MSRFTTAYSSYLERINEIQSLRLTAAEKERSDPTGNRDIINALCRGSLVLLSSHLEGYIKDLGEILISRISQRQIDRSTLDRRVFYHISKDRIEAVRESSKPESVVNSVFAFLNEDHEYWSLNGPFPKQIDIDRFNKGFSNPSFKKIKRYFNRFGYDDYPRDLGRALRANYQPFINILDHLVDIRNKIAHGDPTATKTPQEVRDITSMIQGFCKATDSVFGRWCSSKYCPVR